MRDGLDVLAGVVEADTDAVNVTVSDGEVDNVLDSVAVDGSLGVLVPDALRDHDVDSVLDADDAGEADDGTPFREGLPLTAALVDGVGGGVLTPGVVVLEYILPDREKVLLAEDEMLAVQGILLAGDEDVSAVTARLTVPEGGWSAEAVATLEGELVSL